MRLMPSIFRNEDRKTRRSQSGKLRRRLIKAGILTATIGVFGGGGIIDGMVVMCVIAVSLQLPMM